MLYICFFPITDQLPTEYELRGGGWRAEHDGKMSPAKFLV